MMLFPYWPDNKTQTAAYCLSTDKEILKTEAAIGLISQPFLKRLVPFLETVFI